MTNGSQAFVEERVQTAFASVPRESFLPRRKRRYAGEDRPIEIGHGQTNSQPRTVRAMLELLDVRPGHQVLDVGCGSGWTSGLLENLVDPDGEVLGLEIVPELAKVAAHNLRTTAGPHVTVRVADPEVLGAPDQGPFDRILVSAGARNLPEPLVDQLGVGGRLVVPVRSVMTLVERVAPEDVVVSEHGRYSFVPLIWNP